MSQNEHVPEDLNEGLTDTERTLLALAPRASRIDRDRLMIRLGEQNLAHRSTPWKWATAASLMLALGLGVRPAFEASTGATSPVAIQSDVTLPETTQAETIPASGQEEPRSAPGRQRNNEFDSLLALASGRFDASRTLSVRPGWAKSELALRGSDEPAAEESPSASSPGRTPTLRWGDRRQFEALEFATSPRT